MVVLVVLVVLVAFLVCFTLKFSLTLLLKKVLGKKCMCLHSPVVRATDVVPASGCNHVMLDVGADVSDFS